MTVYTQFGDGFPVPGGDLPFRNLSGLAIAPNTIVLLDSSHGNMSVMAPTDAGSFAGAAGVALSTIPNGGAGAVRCYGAAVCIADGAVAPGDSVRASTATAKMGRAVVCGAGEAQVGMALTRAANGEKLLVLVGPARNDPAPPPPGP